MARDKDEQIFGMLYDYSDSPLNILAEEQPDVVAPMRRGLEPEVRVVERVVERPAPAPRTAPTPPPRRPAAQVQPSVAMPAKPAPVDSTPVAQMTGAQAESQVTGREEQSRPPVWNDILAEAVVTALPLAMDTLLGGGYVPEAAAAGLKGQEVFRTGKERLRKADLEEREMRRREVAAVGATGETVRYTTADDPSPRFGKMTPQGVVDLEGNLVEDPYVGYAPRLRTGAYTKETEIYAPGKGMVPLTPKEVKDKYEFNPRQYSGLQKIRKQVTGLDSYKNAIKQYNYGSVALSQLRLGTTIGDGAAKISLARGSGEVGNLSRTDVAPFTGDKRLLPTLLKAHNEYLTTGTMPEMPREHQMQLAILYRDVGRARMLRQVQNVAAQDMKGLGLEQDQVLDYLSSFNPPDVDYEKILSEARQQAEKQAKQTTKDIEARLEREGAAREKEVINKGKKPKKDGFDPSAEFEVISK